MDKKLQDAVDLAASIGWFLPPIDPVEFEKLVKIKKSKNRAATQKEHDLEFKLANGDYDRTLIYAIKKNTLLHFWKISVSSSGLIERKAGEIYFTGVLWRDEDPRNLIDFGKSDRDGDVRFMTQHSLSVGIKKAPGDFTRAYYDISTSILSDWKWWFNYSLITSGSDRFSRHLEEFNSAWDLSASSPWWKTDWERVQSAISKAKEISCREEYDLESAKAKMEELKKRMEETEERRKQSRLKSIREKTISINPLQILAQQKYIYDTIKN